VGGKVTIIDVKDDSTLGDFLGRIKKPLPDQYWLTSGLKGTSVRMIQIVRKIIRPLGQNGEWWDVRDTRYNYTFQCSDYGLGRILTDMEVLAWASK
jgi:hypothetical protein